jgi:prepilin-type processing-associated H-X9-DG protein
LRSRLRWDSSTTSNTQPRMPTPGQQPNRKITSLATGNDDKVYAQMGLRFRHFERRHNKDGSTNLLMFDGHAESLRYGELCERNTAYTY